MAAGAEYLYFALEGTVMDLMQWLVLRRLLTSAGWRVVASAIGWLVGRLGVVAAGDVYMLLSDRLSDEASMVVAHTAPMMIGGGSLRLCDRGFCCGAFEASKASCLTKAGVNPDG